MSKLFSLLILIVLIGSIGIGVYLSQQRQSLKSRASGSGLEVNLKCEYFDGALNPTNLLVYWNGLSPIDQAREYYDVVIEDITQPGNYIGRITMYETSSQQPDFAGGVIVPKWTYGTQNLNFNDAKSLQRIVPGTNQPDPRILIPVTSGSYQVTVRKISGQQIDDIDTNITTCDSGPSTRKLKYSFWDTFEGATRKQGVKVSWDPTVEEQSKGFYDLKLFKGEAVVGQSVTRISDAEVFFPVDYSSVRSLSLAVYYYPTYPTSNTGEQLWTRAGPIAGIPTMSVPICPSISAEACKNRQTLDNVCGNFANPDLIGKHDSGCPSDFVCDASGSCVAPLASKPAAPTATVVCSDNTISARFSSVADSPPPTFLDVSDINTSDNSTFDSSFYNKEVSPAQASSTQIDNSFKKWQDLSQSLALQPNKIYSIRSYHPQGSSYVQSQIGHFNTSDAPAECRGGANGVEGAFVNIKCEYENGSSNPTALRVWWSGGSYGNFSEGGGDYYDVYVEKNTSGVTSEVGRVTSYYSTSQQDPGVGYGAPKVKVMPGGASNQVYLPENNATYLATFRSHKNGVTETQRTFSTVCDPSPVTRKLELSCSPTSGGYNLQAKWDPSVENDYRGVSGGNYEVVLYDGNSGSILANKWIPVSSGQLDLNPSGSLYSSTRTFEAAIYFSPYITGDPTTSYQRVGPIANIPKKTCELTPVDIAPGCRTISCAPGYKSSLLTNPVPPDRCYECVRDVPPVGGNNPPGALTTTQYYLTEDVDAANACQADKSRCDTSKGTLNPVTQQTFKVNYRFRSPVADRDNQLCVVFMLSDNTRQKQCSSIKLINPDPQITQLSCGLDLLQKGLKIEAKGRYLGSSQGQVTVTGPGVASTTQIVNWGENTDKTVSVTALNKDAVLTSEKNQSYTVTLTRSDGRAVSSSCRIGTTQLSFSGKYYCRGSVKSEISRVQLTIAEAQTNGRQIHQTVKIDNTGLVQGLNTPLQVGKCYRLSIKVPGSVRKTVEFQAQEGTTILPDFRLPVGDVYPADTPDGTINSADRQQLIREWSLIAGKSSNKTSDFNQDGLVNSFDYSCMVYDFNSTDDAEATAAPISASSPLYSACQSGSTTPN